MFVVLYHWRLIPGTEDTFRQAWSKVTTAIRSRHGSLGSRLHRAEDGTWWAYAQWPSRVAFEIAAGGDADPENTNLMKQCVAERLDTVMADVTEDLLAR